MASWREEGPKPPRQPKPAARPESGRPAASVPRKGWRLGSASNAPRHVFLGGDETLPWWKTINWSGPILLSLAGALAVLFVVVAQMWGDKPSLLLAMPKKPLELPFAANDETVRESLVDAEILKPLPDSGDVNADFLKNAADSNAKIYYLLGHGTATWQSNQLVPWIDFDDQVGRDPQPGVNLEEALGKLPENSVVILDASRGRNRWDLGEVYNLFPTAVERAVERLKDKKLCVITSCSEGERDWQPPPLFGSPLFKATMAGLSNNGAGDTYLGTLCLWRELRAEDFASYVRLNAAKYAAGYQLRQTPIVWKTPGFYENTRLGSTSGQTIAVQPDLVKAAEKNYADLLQQASELQAEGGKQIVERIRAQRPLAWAKFEVDLAAAAQSAFSPDFEGVEEAVKSVKQIPLVPLPQPSTPWKNLVASAIEDKPTLNAGNPAELEFVKLIHNHVDWSAEVDALLRADAVRKAFQVRDISERLATCTDPRAHWFSHCELEKLEAKRRHADDLLLANCWQDATDGTDGYKALLEKYEEAERRQNVLVATLRQLDETYAEGPWVAQWLDDEELLNSHNLETSDSAATLSEIDQLCAAYHSASDALWIKTTSSSNQLSAKGHATLPDIGCDEVGSVHRDQEFERLREELNPLCIIAGDSQKYAPSGNEQPQGEPASKSDPSRTRDFVAKQLQDGVHPLQLMLGLRNLEAAKDKTLPQQFAEFSNQAVELIQGLVSRIDSPSDPPPPELNAKQAFEESIQFRRAAWLVAHRTDRGIEELPLDPFYEFCWKAQRRWLAERALLDFWGDGEIADGKYPFQKIASQYYEELNESPESDTTKIAELLNDLQVELGSVNGSNSRRSIAGSIEPKVTPSDAIKARGRKVLTGTAAMSVETEAADPRPLEFEGGLNRVKWVNPTQPFKETLASDATVPTSVNAVLHYRGHVVTRRLELSTPGVLVTRSVVDPTGPEITVYNKDKREVEIAFVLDCSGSMDDDLDGNDVKDSGKPSRWSIAQPLAIQMIDRLEQWGGERCRVSLWLYGHRYRWKKGQKAGFDDRLKQQSWGESPMHDNRRQKVSPDSDVEERVSSSELNEDQSNDIKSAIDQAGPHGPTPLYLAMNKALDKLGSSNSQKKYLLVLTDGANDIFYPIDHVRDPDYKADRVTSRKDSVEIAIVAFATGKVSSLEELASSENLYFPANDSTSLQSSLNRWLDGVLGPVGFNVRKADAPAPGSSNPTPFNPSILSDKAIEDGAKRWRPVEKDFVPGDYILTIANVLNQANGPTLSPIQLDGWEDVEVTFRSTPTLSMRHLPYAGELDFGYAESKRQAKGKRFGTQNQEQDNNATSPLLFNGIFKDSAAEFALGFQAKNHSEQGTRAPDALWVEIRPTGAAKDTVYYASDAWPEHRNVPLYKWTIPSWPSAAKNAQLKYYASFGTDLKWETWNLDSPSATKARCQWSATWERTKDGENSFDVLVVQSTNAAASQVLVRLHDKRNYWQSLERFERRQTEKGGPTVHRFVFKAKPQRVAIDFLPAATLKQACETAQPGGTAIHGESREIEVEGQ